MNNRHNRNYFSAMLEQVQRTKHQLSNLLFLHKIRASSTMKSNFSTDTVNASSRLALLFRLIEAHDWQNIDSMFLSEPEGQKNISVHRSTGCRVFLIQWNDYPTCLCKIRSSNKSRSKNDRAVPRSSEFSRLLGPHPATCCSRNWSV
mmetsp:Transcript_8781/g.21307  ORF Transcript_8781/g.21307 Transcript_8781/m.21307 type:complete len:147 (+) Transcript_8781:433-873(+)